MLQRRYSLIEISLIALLSAQVSQAGPCDSTDRICMPNASIPVGTPFPIYVYTGGFLQKDPTKWSVSLYKGDLQANPNVNPCDIPSDQLLQTWPPTALKWTIDTPQPIAQVNVTIEPTKAVLDIIQGGGDQNRFFFQAKDQMSTGNCPLGPYLQGSGVTHVALLPPIPSPSPARAPTPSISISPSANPKSPVGDEPDPATTKINPQSSSSSSSQAGLIAGIVVAALAALAVGGFLYARRRRNGRTRQWGVEGGHETGPGMAQRKSTSGSSTRLVPPTFEEEMHVGTDAKLNESRDIKPGSLSPAAEPIVYSNTSQENRDSSVTDPFSDAHGDPFVDPPQSANPRRSILASLHRSRSLLVKTLSRNPASGTPATPEAPTAQNADRHTMAMLIAEAFRQELADPKMEWDKQSLGGLSVRSVEGRGEVRESNDEIGVESEEAQEGNEEDETTQ